MDDRARCHAPTGQVTGEGIAGALGRSIDDAVRERTPCPLAAQANAFGGPGGNITIRAGQLIRTPDSVIQASSAQSVSGTISIAGLNQDIAGSLVVLPETFLDASSQLREACAARGGRPGNSFIAGGRGGLPPDPGTPLAASSFGQPLEQQSATDLPTPSSRSSPAVKPITVAGIPQPVLGSPRLTCRG